ncbi:hypothetical protein Tco_0460950 [Tanacetum coccineum]
MELKRRNMKKTDYDIQYVVSIKEDTAYLCLQGQPICRIQAMEIKYSGRYRTWSLLQETPNTPHRRLLIRRNSQVKDCKIDHLTQQYKKFSISDEETIDSGFTRFNAIVTSIKSLDQDYSSKNHVRKFLRALPLKWREKVTTIEEAKDLATLHLDELIGNLKVYEMILKNDGVASKTTKEKVKSMAPKVKVTREQTSDDSDSQGGSDEDVDEEEAEAFNLMARNFRKLFRKECMPKHSKVLNMLNAPWSTCDQKFKAGIVSPDRSTHNIHAYPSKVVDARSSEFNAMFIEVMGLYIYFHITRFEVTAAMLAVFDPWIKEGTGLVLCDRPHHVSGSDWWFDNGRFNSYLKSGSIKDFGGSQEMKTPSSGKLWLYDEVRTRLCLFWLIK